MYAQRTSQWYDVHVNRSASLADYVDSLQEQGRYTFSREEALAALGSTPIGLKRAAERLTAKRRLTAPRRGFYTIVPLEYRSAGALPASSFIDALMRHHGVAYYVGLLSAAEIHGAAHQRPQEFQVVASKQLRPVTAGRNRIRFFLKKGLDGSPVEMVKNASGHMRVSSPETTALDLVRFHDRVGGLNHVATVLAELAEKIQPAKLAAAAEGEVERAHVQRLGYLLDLVGKSAVTGELWKSLQRRDPKTVLLSPGGPAEAVSRDSRWRVAVNQEVEPDEL